MFQWTGGIGSGQAHASIVQRPTFMFEYAQNRNNAVGHVHTVWRDFDGDFGGDIRHVLRRLLRSTWRG